MKPDLQRADPDEETLNWRAVCGKTARTVRREGRASVLPYPYRGSLLRHHARKRSRISLRCIRATRLCRYIMRPAIGNERLKRDGAGDVVLQLKSAWRDGTTHIKMSPLEFMQCLAALVPRPRLHLLRFQGVLAPNAGLRAAIVAGPPENTSEPADEHAHGAPARLSWSRLRRRVFDLDVGRCVCGGKLKIIAAIEEPAVIVKILTHLGLPARGRRARRLGRWRSCRLHHGAGDSGR